MSTQCRLVILVDMKDKKRRIKINPGLKTFAAIHTTCEYAMCLWMFLAYRCLCCAISVVVWQVIMRLLSGGADVHPDDVSTLAFALALLAFSMHPNWIPMVRFGQPCCLEIYVVHSAWPRQVS